MELCGMKNGVFSYHIDKLEKKRKIVSKRFGRKRRFWVAGRMTEYTELSAIQKDIISKLRNCGGMNITRLAILLKTNHQNISYNVKRLVDLNILKYERNGRLAYVELI